MVALKYLDLSWCKIDQETLEKLLESCYDLKELSMGNLTLSSKMMNKLFCQNGQTLQKLNLQLCWGLDLNSVQRIFKVVDRESSMAYGLI